MSSEHYSSVPFPCCSEKEEKDVFLRKRSNQNVFHVSGKTGVCVSVYFSVHNIFVSLNVLFNQPDYILWLQVRLQAAFLNIGKRHMSETPFSKMAPVCSVFLCSDLHVSNYYYFLK